MQLEKEQFYYDSELCAYTAEASSLRLKPGYFPSQIDVMGTTYYRDYVSKFREEHLYVEYVSHLDNVPTVRIYID